jgi:hypothetical protein
MTDSYHPNPTKNQYGFFILLFIASFVVLACRNFVPYTFPTLYAEDGVWLGLIMTNGFWDAAMHARPDFPTLGLVGLLDFSLIITKLFFSGDLTALPRMIFLYLHLLFR